MGQGRVPVTVAVVALVFAAVASFTFASSPPQSPRGAAAAARFLTAWERKLRGTYVVDATLSRTTASGATFRYGTRLVQRPPDRLVIGLGSVEGRLGGKLVRCGAVVTDPCGPSSVDAPAYDSEVTAELDTLRTYVEGSAPLYTVLLFEDVGCFRLTLARALPAPPYGDEALFCFDKGTGAPTTTVIRRGSATERTDAAAVRGAVADADLAIPEDRGEPAVVDPASTTTSVPGG